MLVNVTRLQFDPLIPNTSEVVIERQISQINNGGNRTISFKTGDNVLARDYRNNNNKWQKVAIRNTHDVELDDGTIWKRHNDQLLIDKSLTPASNSISLTPARNINENTENAETVYTNQNPDPTIIYKTPRPIRSRKPPQRYSPTIN
ncbi:Uncharacterized protein FWK35_00036749 [Aphis craccivora]|uniref:Uncharacterized protein n=1 Tax=Aphis craccivora TaxID=307492 RepID=A0A6G0VJI0_APHCR|nr:Uncharacterized protein FWK35_00036749 [Aphis craccivora]